MKIGISGASGQLGRATLRELGRRTAAESLVGISRTPDTVAAMGVEARFGDFDQTESLRPAFAGLDRLLIIPTTDMRPGARLQQNLRAIDAAVAAGVEHVVFMSSVGTRAADVPHVWESYFGAEQRLMQTARRWTVLRMAYYAESFIDEARRTLGAGVHAALSSTPVNFVSRDDLAAAAAGLLAGEGHHGAIYQGTGPESLDGPARAAVIARATGQPFAFTQVPREGYAAALAGMQLPAFLVDAVLSIQDCWAAGGFDLTSGDVQRLSGRAPRALAAIAAEAFGAA